MASDNWVKRIIRKAKYGNRGWRAYLGVCNQEHDPRPIPSNAAYVRTSRRGRVNG
jgi:hypothetical protein